MQFNKKKVAAAVGAAAVVASGAGVAYAYWTTSGTGDGTVAAQSSLSGFAVSGDAVSGNPLYPGASQALSGKVTNKDVNSPAQLQTLVATIQAPTHVGTDSTKPACTAADYALSGGTGWSVASDKLSATFHPNVELTKNASAGDTYSFSGLTVQMLDRSDTTAGDGSGNQDNCKGATFNISYDAS